MIASARRISARRRRPSMGMQRPLRRKDPFGYVGGESAIEGVGYDVTLPDRTRRAFAMVAGLMASADRHLSKSTLSKLREICRAHDRQSGIFSGMLDTACDNIWGSNFGFIPATEDNDLDKEIEDYIGLRMEKRYADAAGLRSFARIGSDSTRALWTDGDILHAKQPNGSVMTFEAHENESPPGLPRIVLGVEKAKSGRHTAYWVRQVKAYGTGGSQRADKHRRIPASRVFRAAFMKRFSQTRGVPFAAAVLSFASRFTNYIDFEAVAAEINSMLGYQINKEPTDADITGNTPPGTTTSEETDGEEGVFDKLQRMEPGMVFDLAEGEKIAMIGAERPGSNFDAYITTCCRIIGVGVGLPLELFLKDFSKTNYSSARASLAEARRSFRRWQRIMQDDLCGPWYRWQIARGIASGALPADERCYKMECNWPVWEYLDPEKDARANVMQVGTMTKSPIEVIRERGRNPRQVVKEIAEYKQMCADEGLEYITPQVGIKVNVVSESKNEDEKENEDK